MQAIKQEKGAHERIHDSKQKTFPHTVWTGSHLTVWPCPEKYKNTDSVKYRLHFYSFKSYLGCRGETVDANGGLCDSPAATVPQQTLTQDLETT